jgi:hypothetical protein
MSKDPSDDKRSAWKPARQQRRRGTYFRVEMYETTSLCWLDAPGTFGSIEEASAYIAQELTDRQARIMKIDGRKRTVVS